MAPSVPLSQTRMSSFIQAPHVTWLFYPTSMFTYPPFIPPTLTPSHFNKVPLVWAVIYIEGHVYLASTCLFHTQVVVYFIKRKVISRYMFISCQWQLSHCGKRCMFYTKNNVCFWYRKSLISCQGGCLHHLKEVHFILRKTVQVKEGVYADEKGVHFMLSLAFTSCQRSCSTPSW